MIKDVIDAWNDRKDILRQAIEKTFLEDVDYEEMVRLIAIHIIGIEEDDLLLVKAETDEYQGCICFLFCHDRCSCYGFHTTLAYYGSCSGCDTILGITQYQTGLPRHDQVDELMDLCLSLVQRIKRPYDYDAKEMEVSA